MKPGGPDENVKQAVHGFWNQASCGEVSMRGESLRAQFEAQARLRYDVEPYLAPFARFHDGKGHDVLEIGVGVGADHLEWARSGPRSLSGIDLTERAVEKTAERLAVYGFRSDLRVADAERLPFPDASFDIVYSYGVLHHTPNTPAAVEEVRRVLRPNAIARIMIYHSPSIVGLLLWTRYGLLAGKPWTPLSRIYAEELESPGTKAYSIAEARALFARFSEVEARSQVSHGDLLDGVVGQRHRSRALEAAKVLWPRRILKRMNVLGTALLIDAKK